MTSTMLKSDNHVIIKVVLHACYSQIPPVIPNRCTYYSQCIAHYSHLLGCQVQVDNSKKY